MSYLFIILFFVCIFGLFKPFKGLKRAHFGIGAVVSFALVGVTAPPPESGKTASTAAPKQPISKEEAATLEQKNASEIAVLVQKVAKLPAEELETNRDAYKRLVELAPANGKYAEKLASFETKIEARARYDDNPQEALSLGKVDWYKGGFESIMMIRRAVITNNAPFAIKDFTLKCSHFAPSGTEIDQNTRTIFEVIPANGSTTIREFNMGFIAQQADSTSCEITKAAAA